MEQPISQGTDSTQPGVSLSTIRGTAISSGLGGLLLVAYAIVMALKPRGCIGEECVGRSYRESGPDGGILVLGAIGLIIAATAGLFAIHRFEGRGSKVVRIAALVAASSLLVGVGLLGSAMWWLGFIVLVLAFLAFAVTGAGLMISRVLPAWSGAMLLVTSLLLFGMNDQNEAVLLVIPFGLAWIVLGGLLWAAASSPTKGWHSRVQHA